MDERWEKLKQELFNEGHAAIEDFLGQKIDPLEEKDVTENRLDQTYNQLRDDWLEIWFRKYHI